MSGFTNHLMLSGSLGGVSLNSKFSVEATGALGQQFDTPAAKSGNLTIRESDTAGTLTMADGHGIAENDVFDLYHSGGVTYGCVAGAVVGNTVPFTGGSGAVLPVFDFVNESPITAQVCINIDIDFDGDTLVALGILASKVGHIAFLDAADTVLLAIPLLAGQAWFWLDDTVATNPLAGGVVASARVSNGATTAGTFRLGGLYNSQV